MVPVLEHDVDGDGPQVFEEAVCRPPCRDSFAPGQHGQPGGRVKREREQLRSTRSEARVCLPCPKSCSRLYPPVLSTLKVSFSIFHRARPQAASSATLAAVTARSVTKLL